MSRRRRIPDEKIRPLLDLPRGQLQRPVAELVKRFKCTDGTVYTAIGRLRDQAERSATLVLSPTTPLYGPRPDPLGPATFEHVNRVYRRLLSHEDWLMSNPTDHPDRADVVRECIILREQMVEKTGKADWMTFRRPRHY